MSAALDPDTARTRTPRVPQLQTPPLTWWRVLPPEALGLTAQRRLRIALVIAPPLPSPAWAAACRADPAAAIRVAVAALAEAVALPGRVDPAMSAVCLCAARGDAACVDLLVHVLERRVRRRATLDALSLVQTSGSVQAWRSVQARRPLPAERSAPRRGPDRADAAR